MDATAAMLSLSLYGIILHNFLLFVIGALFVMTVMQYIPAWCYFCEAS